ncbi:hypothetical protein F2Q68_00021754 [Brassica cretica]|uniref:Uncharacterized protein n=2 Tax=Brassica cretica TaxID=69181 RepID=A0ABQ7CT92_BRACR|nr:hypothetical protein F2Q68_00021754 [Brassica cretica]KAF3562514.1 hypothetical protein DY000_02017224 [Brassica cretica]
MDTRQKDKEKEKEKDVAPGERTPKMWRDRTMALGRFGYEVLGLWPDLDIIGFTMD